MKELLYTTALDNQAELIHVSQAQKGNSFACPLCKSELILKKSGRTGKGSKRPHFAHHQLTSNCTPESVLHYSFKKFLKGILEQYVSDKKPLIINWSCSCCSNPHNRGNLLARTVTIEEEYNLEVCRPDLALLDAEGKTVAAIEIVVTHKPEQEVVQYYETNGITLVQIDLDSEEDLEKIIEKITNPRLVNTCLNPKCPSLKTYPSLRKLLCQIKPCDQCKKPMRACHVEMNSAFGSVITTEFTAEELHTAQAKGVQFRMKEDQHNRKSYPVIQCLSCEAYANWLKAYNQRLRSRYGGRRF